MMRVRDRRFMSDDAAAAKSNSKSAGPKWILYNFSNRSPGVRHAVESDDAWIL
jgi:hypothetical protein